MNKKEKEGGRLEKWRKEGDWMTVRRERGVSGDEERKGEEKYND